jgi:outer membrane murein-binding lipoprotein Lpp
VAIIVAAIGALGVVTGALVNFKIGMTNSDRDRIRDLEARVTELEDDREADREYIAQLRDHIYRGLPPPPPPRPNHD